MSENINITLSIVSHLQGNLVVDLLNDLIKINCKNIKVILTINQIETLSFKAESFPFPVLVINNHTAKGFGANHNQAFTFCDTPYFCVINPDIRIQTNPFDQLIFDIEKYTASLAAPMVLNSDSNVEDSVRKFPTPISILTKIITKKSTVDYPLYELIVNPDWVGGMFMMFKSNDFKLIGGFDERYFLYYEDVDICKSLHKANKKILYTPNCSVVHAARRDSHKKLRYLILHIKSMLIFFSKY